MAWEIGPAPDVVVDAAAPNTLELIGPEVDAWAIGPAPNTIVGTLPWEYLALIESVPVVAFSGTGSIEITATGTVTTVAATVRTMTGTGSISMDGTGTVSEIEAAEAIIVVVTGTTAIEFQIEALGGAVIVYEATGTGSLSIGGTGTVSSITPAVPIVATTGTGSISVSGSGLVDAVVPAAIVVLTSGTGTIQIGGTGLVTTLLIDPDNESVAPVISNFSPEPGSPLTHLQAISFDVTDNTGFRRILVAVRYANSITELAHNGTTFEYGYSGTVSDISGGLNFSLRRNSGWKGAPTIVIYAIDQHGNEATNGD